MVRSRQCHYPAIFRIRPGMTARRRLPPRTSTQGHRTDAYETISWPRYGQNKGRTVDFPREGPRSPFREEAKLFAQLRHTIRAANIATTIIQDLDRKSEDTQGSHAQRLPENAGEYQNKTKPVQALNQGVISCPPDSARMCLAIRFRLV